jgi:hypothetical protein
MIALRSGTASRFKIALDKRSRSHPVARLKHSLVPCASGLPKIPAGEGAFVPCIFIDARK